VRVKIFNLLTIEYEKRQEITLEQSLKLTTMALVTAFIIMGIIFAGFGVNPFLAIFSIFAWSLFTPAGFTSTLTRMIPLLLCGVGLAIAFRALFWNIGAEGQLLMGAIAATGIALFVPGIPDFLLLPTILLMGFIVGALWGLIPAALKLKFETNEVITTLMLNYVAFRLVKYLVYGPWKGKKVYNFPFSDTFPPAAWEPKIPGTPIYVYSFVLSLLFAVGLYFFMNKTTLGYEIRVVGENIKAARYAGINYTKTILITMLISGGLAGLAGAGLMTGVQHRLQNPEAISPGYGYTAIIVAWLGRLNPLYVILSAFFMAILIVGGQQIQITLGLPFGVVNIFNGVILFVLIAFEPLREYRVSFYWNEKYPWGSFMNKLFSTVFK